MTRAAIPDRLEVYRDDAGEWRWRRSDGNNGKKLAVSSEGCTKRSHAIAMAWSMNADLDVLSVRHGDVAEVLARPEVEG